MRANVMLCDFAESVNGKLYISGGGWTDVQLPAEAPFPCAVAILLFVSWNEVNRPHELKLSLVDHDSQPVSDPEGNEIKQEGTFEVGRPPRSIPGQDFALTMAIRYGALPLPAGAYAFTLEVDKIELDRTSFRVVRLGEAP